LKGSNVSSSGLETDSGSEYYRKRMEGQSDEEARETSVDKDKKEVENYLNESSSGLQGKQWYTVSISNHDQSVSVYRGQGLNMKRDDIDEDDLNEDYQYMEVSEDELRDLLKSKRVYNWRLMRK